MKDLHEALLRGLAPGGIMWLRASGKSLWPLLRDGDSLRVERCTESSLRRGEVAVVKLPSGVLAAHLVADTQPLSTVSSVGVVDPQPVEGLGRVTGFRRGGEVSAWPASARLLLRHLPGAATLLKRLPFTRGLVHRLRD